jgi:hypothetical protein
VAAVALTAKGHWLVTLATALPLAVAVTFRPMTGSVLGTALLVGAIGCGLGSITTNVGSRILTRSAEHDGGTIAARIGRPMRATLGITDRRLVVASSGNGPRSGASNVALRSVHSITAPDSNNAVKPALVEFTDGSRLEFEMTSDRQLRHVRNLGAALEPATPPQRANGSGG